MTVKRPEGKINWIPPERRTSQHPVMVKGYAFFAYDYDASRTARYCEELDALAVAETSYNAWTVKIGENFVESEKTGKPLKFGTRGRALEIAVKKATERAWA